jgi:tetratricopeptide (TPR) repeat protein
MLRLRSRTVVTLLLSASAWAGPSACDAGMTQFRAREWSDAAMSLANCEAAAPGQTDALLFRGKALVNLGKYDEAAEALENYAVKHPQSDDALYTLGFVQFRQNKPRESLATFTKAAAIKTPTADDLKVVSLDYVLLDDAKDAARYLEDALRMDPANVDARYSLGRVRYQLNQFDQAIAAFEEVLRRDPVNLKAEYNLGLSYEGENRVDDAISCYQKAIAMEKVAANRDEQPYLDLGALLSRSNRASEAIPYLQRGAEIKPDSGKVQYELAKAYLATGNTDQALVSGERAIRLAPDESSYHYLLGRVYAKAGKQDLATAQFQQTDALLKKKGAPDTPHTGDPRQ